MSQDRPSPVTQTTGSPAQPQMIQTIFPRELPHLQRLLRVHVANLQRRRRMTLVRCPGRPGASQSNIRRALSASGHPPSSCGAAASTDGIQVTLSNFGQRTRIAAIVSRGSSGIASLLVTKPWRRRRSKVPNCPICGIPCPIIRIPSSSSSRVYIAAAVPQ